MASHERRESQESFLYEFKSHVAKSHESQITNNTLAEKPQVFWPKVTNHQRVISWRVIVVIHKSICETQVEYPCLHMSVAQDVHE